MILNLTFSQRFFWASVFVVLVKAELYKKPMGDNGNLILVNSGSPQLIAVHLVTLRSYNGTGKSYFSTLKPAATSPWSADHPN